MHHPAQWSKARPQWSAVLRGLRKAHGVTQDGWATLIGVGRATVQRWERGEAAPSADAAELLFTLCREQGLFRTFAHGPLRGLSITPALLRELLADARHGDTPTPLAPPSIALLPARPPVPPSALPIPVTRLVGREDERAAITQLLASNRLVTLTGPGGTGKTRLALALAAELAQTFADGVVFVDLAPLRDPELVPVAIASALHVQGASDLSLVDRLAIVLRDRLLLLLLDNFEHLLPAAPLVARLLQATPQLTVLITSRAPLRVRGERTFPVTPLQPPLLGTVMEPGILISSPAVALFVERAQAVQPDIALTEANAPTVADICRRLDGLPLALELAAARVQHLSVAAIAARLDTRLTLLTDGARDLPARQQTLRNTIAWSYDLLTPEEQALFCRLAVFAGGCTIEAVAAVCEVDSDLGRDVLDGLSALVDASLLQRRDGPDGEPRFRMLETVREYAAERLTASGEADTVRRRHAACFVALAEEIAPRLRQANRFPWLPRLDAERDNLRAAQAWSRAETDGGEASLRLAGALWYYWQLRGAFDEGRRASAAALALPAAHQPGRARAAALFGAGFLAREAEGDLPIARSLFEECAGLGPEQGGLSTYALALAFLAAMLAATGELDKARRLAEDSRTLAQSLQEHWTLTWANQALFQVCFQAGNLAGARDYADEVLWVGRKVEIEPIGLSAHAMVDIAEGRFDQARTRFTELLALARTWDFAFLVARALGNLAMIALRQGDLHEAATLFEECVECCRRIGVDTSWPLVQLAWVLLDQGGSPDNAAALLVEALPLIRQLGLQARLVACLGGLAQVAVVAGDPARGARLLGAAAVEQPARAVSVSELPRAELDRTSEMARELLGVAGFASAWAAGAALALDVAVTEALCVPALVRGDASAAASAPAARAGASNP